MRFPFAKVLLASLSAYVMLANNTLAKIPLDSNSAFYEGQNYNFILPAPPTYRMVVEEAGWEGYSFAFVPEKSSYTSAPIHIGISIYKHKDISLKTLLTRDTTQIRRDFGTSITIRQVDPLRTSSGEMVKVFYIDDKKRFVPTVILAYLDGVTEYAVYQLSITENTPRFEAEIAFDEAIRRIKLLKRATLPETKK